MFKILPRPNALSKGSSLWITPSPSSPLSRQLDWLTLFKARIANNDKPLLIESSLYLPCSHICFLPLKENPIKWLEHARSCWNDLNKPSLKIFLPNNLSQKELTQHWPYEPLPYTIKLVMDYKTHAG